MKKILSVIVSVIVSVGMNAQVVKVYENGELKGNYTNSSTNTVKVVFEEAPAYPAGSRGTAAVSTTAGISGNQVQWVQLWAGGPKWAVFNVGATSISEYGGYYYWGSTNTTSYSSSTEDIQYGADDTAKNLWGVNWQMPKSEDYDNLISTDNTDGGNWKSSTESGYGVAGLLVKGKSGTAYANNSVFFPAAGIGGEGQGLGGGYWSSSPSGSALGFLSGSPSVENYVLDNGYSVRAVLKD